MEDAILKWRWLEVLTSPNPILLFSISVKSKSLALKFGVPALAILEDNISLRLDLSARDSECTLR